MATKQLIDQWNAWAGETVFASDATQAQKDVDSFKSRVSMAMVAAALAIQSEGADKPYHAPRSVLAQSVLGNPSVWAPAFAQAVASQSFDNASSDQEIRDTISSVWNALSGLS